jgi:hypothetical protein
MVGETGKVVRGLGLYAWCQFKSSIVTEFTRLHELICAYMIVFHSHYNSLHFLNPCVERPLTRADDVDKRRTSLPDSITPFEPSNVKHKTANKSPKF